MADSYHIIDGKVIPFSGGRKCNDTGAWRDATPLELQLQEQLEEYENTIAAQSAEIDAMRKAVEQLTADLQAAREDGWQPIETAPKDGTRVLLWFGWHDLPVVGDFRHGRWWSVHSLGGNLPHPNGMDWKEVIEPSCWRPLPPPPVLESAREERDALAQGGEE